MAINAFHYSVRKQRRTARITERCRQRKQIRGLGRGVGTGVKGVVVEEEEEEEEGDEGGRVGGWEGGLVGSRDISLSRFVSAREAAGRGEVFQLNADYIGRPTARPRVCSGWRRPAPSSPPPRPSHNRSGTS